MTASTIQIDLVSDTSTRPCKAMRHAMADAPVGDEQRGEDPSVNALNERVADLLGQERALFLPSGTMCNQIALAVHCHPGDEVIAASSAHIIASEGAGAAVFARSVIRQIASANGIFTADQLREAIRPGRVKSPRSRVVAVEQTNNRGGGSVWPLDVLAGVIESGAERRPQAAHGRRSADERSGRLRRRGKGVCRAVRQRLARSVERARLPGRRCARRLVCLHRRGGCLEAPLRRRHAPGGHHRCCGSIRAQTTMWSVLRKTTRMPAPLPLALRKFPALPCSIPQSRQISSFSMSLRLPLRRGRSATD